MDWQECCGKRIVKEVQSDQEMIKSLLKSSRNKLESEQRLPLDEVTVAAKISLVYDSLRELLEALTLNNGYKIYNHECYTAFLKEILNEGEQADEFDDIRKVRNAVNYYGKEISIEDGRKFIKRISTLREVVFTKYLQNFK